MKIKLPKSSVLVSFCYKYGFMLELYIKNPLITHLMNTTVLGAIIYTLTPINDALGYEWFVDVPTEENVLKLCKPIIDNIQHLTLPVSSYLLFDFKHMILKNRPPIPLEIV